MLRFLPISPKTKQRLPRKKAIGSAFRYKLFEMKEEERLSRFMETLSIERLAQRIVQRCIDNVFKEEVKRSLRKKSVISRKLR